ncbi:MAG: ATP-binding cassette domain-containing protein [Anaerolineales bacterium]
MSRFEGCPLKAVQAKIPHRQAVETISYKIDPGEVVGFLGPNGAGRTTTLRLFSGMLFHISGTSKALGFIGPATERNQ